MRIAIVSEYYRPWPGGISEHVHHEALELRSRGHKVLIVTGPGPVGSGEPEVVRLGSEVRFTSNGALSRIAFGPQLVGLRQLFRSRQVELVHVHAPLDPLLGMAAAIASETTTVGTFHASFRPSLLWHVLYRVLRPLTGQVFRRLHARIAVSEEARKSIAHFFPADYTIIPNGVDTNRFHSETPPKPAGLDRPPTVLFVGRTDPRKGLPLLLAAFRKVRRQVRGARLVVVTGGLECLKRLREEVDPAMLDGVRFEAYVSPDLLPGYYTGCDVFCSPATGGESQGIVLLEAMATGKPVVAFDIPGYRELITHGKEGLLVSTAEPGRLADVLSQLLMDARLRDSMGDEGRRTALRYSWASVGERLDVFFAEARATVRGGV